MFEMLFNCRGKVFLVLFGSGGGAAQGEVDARALSDVLYLGRITVGSTKSPFLPVLDLGTRVAVGLSVRVGELQLLEGKGRLSHRPIQPNGKKS